MLDERLEQVEVPSTLRSVLQARLDALSVAERLALQRASVIGRVFWDDAVELDAHGAGDRFRTDRGAGTRRPSTGCAGARSSTSARSRRSSTTGSSCSSTPSCATSPTRGCCAGHRRTYHTLAARWFEQMAERTGRADEYAGLIADHHANGGDREAAARWYLAAGRQAARSTGSPTPGACSTSGLDLVPPSATLLRFDLLLAREAVLDRLGDRPAQRPTWRSSTRSSRPSPRPTRHAASGCC